MGHFDLTPHAGQVLRGVDRFANSVKQMLGPKADFFSTFSSPEPSTEDLIAWGVNADDPYEVMGARVLTEAAINTNRLSGGGATTTTILSEFILRESARLLNDGIDPVDLQHGIELAVKQVVRALRRQAHKDLTAAHYAQVGTMAADGDHEIGLIVGRTVSPQARPGLITIDYTRRATPRVRVKSAPDGYKIFVGGVTKDDAERRKTRLENAIQSAQAAVEEGVVAGGGAALLHASTALDGIITMNEGQRAGVDLVRRALEAPIRQLAENAAVNGTAVVDHLMHQSDWRLGYDVESFSYVDMLQAGLIDPAKTVRTAMQGAAMVGTAFLMTASPAETSPLSAKRNRYVEMFAPDLDWNRQVAARSRGAHLAGTGGPLSRDETKTAAAKKPARYLTGRFPETVAVDEPAELTVQVVMQAAAGPSSKLADLDVPEHGLSLSVVVEADHFDFRTPPRALITLMPDGNSSGALFEMLATETGETSIRISVFNGGTQVGCLEIPVDVKAARSGSPKRPNRRQTSEPLESMISEPGDVALLVAFDKTSKKYTFTWMDYEDGPQPPATLDETYARMEDIREKVIKNIEEVVRLDHKTSPADAKNTMKTRGIKVWEQLIPPEIRSRFLTNHAHIRRIKIFSDGDPIPWEMLYPTDDKSDFDEGFLIQQVDVSRWRVGSLPPTAISLCTADFAIPKGDLKNAKAEVKKLFKLLKDWNELLKEQYIEKKDQLLELIDKALVNLLHFACHNGFEEGGDQIMFGTQPMTPEDLNGRKNKLKKTAPLVFMNACRTDRKEAEYTEIGGWANSFLGMGVGAFIGTLWEVRDASASEFATVFYEHFVGGESIAEALNCARNALRNKSPSDPTWLAYSFYGYGGAHVKK